MIFNSIRRIIASIVFVLSVSTLVAQNYWFKNIGLGQGLSSSQVNTICKDSNGFIWFGTSAGLNRFDGTDIRQFLSNYSLASALPDSYIISIQEGDSGLLWIKTNGGYVVLDPVTLTFDRSVSQRLSMLSANLEPEIVYFDKWHNLWVYDKDNAIYYYKVKQQLVYTMNFDDNRVGLKKGTVSALCDSKEGMLVAYTNGSVCCISPEHQKVLWFNDVIANNSTQEDDYDVFGDDNGNLWVYGDAHSFFYEKANRRWYRSISELAHEWGSDISIGNSLVTGVTADSKGNIWVSTDRSGLLVINPAERSIKAHITSGGERGLLSNNLMTVYMDDTDLLWVGTMRTGVSFYAPNLYMFDTFNLGDVYGISEDVHGGLWLATHGNGLVYSDPLTGATSSYTMQDGMNDNSLSCVLAASDGSIWAGSNRFGLNRINSNGISVMQASSANKSGLRDNNVQALDEDRFGNIWIGTRKGGLQCFNTKNGHFSNFCVQNGKLNSDNVTCLHTSGTQIVAGTMNGIMLLNISSNKSTLYTGTASGDKHFTSNVITQVYIDKRGLIWVGTRDGLNVLDPSVDQLHSFLNTDGLLSNVICGIAEDGNGDIWVSTSKGVNRITVQNATSDNLRFAFNFYGYDVNDGLQGVEFNMGAMASTHKGRIYMGGQNGINCIRHIELKKRSRPLNVILSRLIIDDQPIEVGAKYNGSVILSRTINSTDKLRVNSSYNEVSIMLGVDDYNHAEPARFIYQLEGRSDNWIPVAGDGNILKLQGLSSGKYTLHIKAMLDDGKTVSEEHILKIEVSKPWYKSWWFYLIVLVFVCLFAYLCYRIWPFIVGYYHQRKKELVALRKRQEEIDSVAQELRSSVVSMIPQLGILQMEIKTPEHKEVLNGLHFSARQMLVNLNRLKDTRQNVLINDEGMSTGVDEAMDDILIGDDGPVVEDGVSEDFLVSDEGIIGVGGVPLKSNTSKYLIYIVEADQDMLEFVADCLKNTFNIRTFTRAEECWNAIAEQRPSLIMCAEHLQGKATGTMLCEKVKNERSYERIPFILTTDGVFTQAEIGIKRVTLLADDYIPAPYNLQSVTQRINKLLGEPLDENLSVDDTIRGAEAMVNAVNLHLRQLLDQYVRQNISRKELSIEEMGRVLGVSRTVLFRKIENVTRLSPSDYIRQVRLEEAAKLLESGFVSPAEVAQELGFGNLATFSRFFQTEYGVLPSQYAEGKRK